MAVTTEELALKPAVSGDTWSGLSNISVRINGVPPAVPLRDVEMRFTMKSNPCKEALVLSSDNGDIDITDAAAWEFNVGPVNLPLSPDIYYWGITTTDTGRVKKTYLRGTIPILRA